MRWHGRTWCRRAVSVALVCVMAACGSTVGSGERTAAERRRVTSDGSLSVTPEDGSASAAGTGSVGSSGQLAGGANRSPVRTGAAAASGVSASIATNEPIKIGVVYPIGNPLLVFGLPGVDTSPEQTEAEVLALVDDIQTKGGFGGHRAVIDFQRQDRTDESEGTMTRLQNEVCVHVTEAAKDDVVLTLAGASTSYANDCYAKHGVPLLTLTPGSEDDFHRLAPWLLPPPTFNIARMARLLPVTLAEAGFLTSKMAVVAFDRNPERALAERYLIPGLRARGGQVIDHEYIPLNYDAIAAGTANAVLRFRSAGVDRVVFLAPGGGEVGVFSRAAESQNYRPRYGMSSLDNPDFASTLMPAEQRKGATGPGVVPAADVAPSKRPPLTARQRSCLDFFNKKFGTSYGGTDTGSILALARCEIMYLTQAGFRSLTGRTFTRTDLRSSFFAIGDSFESYLSQKLRFSPSAVDSIAAYARFAVDDACQCFAYATPFRDIPDGV